MMSKHSCASARFVAKTDGQSKDLQAGTTPAVEKTPFVGLRPIRLFKAAGTLPEPAVSVPSEMGTIPLATTTAEPADEPPETYLLLKEFFVMPYGDRVPTRPVAN
ncbi:hypothetical protein OGATHE_000530 [Ogataea polymorpha]|uniref:Uncharacterized protein n=1 Tax=Ogataea polymorpha TaxID=460523 RepID=A0A9P8PTA6_9ASCO|nr:hypothetical protein OGATHE_000530 [Ogataea polymorpha]